MKKDDVINELGGSEAVDRMTDEERADGLEHVRLKKLEDESRARRAQREPARLHPLPPRPTLVDVYRLRILPAFESAPYPQHLLQSAARAEEVGMPERTVFACLLHDVTVQTFKLADHGYWAAQLVEPYVDERITWGIRYHQALRFFPDPAVGYEYPEMYTRIFGRDYEPPEYIRRAHEMARNHRWYMEARAITLNDEYAFDPAKAVGLDRFVEVLERNFRNPDEGLGYDGSPVAHMWRALANPGQLL